MNRPFGDFFTNLLGMIVEVSETMLGVFGEVSKRAMNETNWIDKYK